MNEEDKAEFIQSLKAYLIPSSMFIACLLNAAGIFLISNGHTLGAVFLGAGFSIIIWALVAFIQFQNKLRADGRSRQVRRTQAAQQEQAEEAEPVTHIS